MTPYRVLLAPSARRDLARLPAAAIRRVRPAVLGLAADPRPIGVKKLIGSRCEWRIRVGDYRILYEIADAPREVRVYRVAHRREAYR